MFFVGWRGAYCFSILCLQTDLHNTDYTLEAGAIRLFEAEKIAFKMAEEAQKAKEEEEMNPMTVTTSKLFSKTMK